MIFDIQRIKSLKTFYKEQLCLARHLKYVRCIEEKKPEIDRGAEMKDKFNTFQYFHDIFVKDQRLEIKWKYLL